MNLKTSAFLLMVCSITALTSCKKQEVVSQEADKPLTPNYMPIGTVIADSASISKQISNHISSGAKSGAKLAWLEEMPGGFTVGWQPGYSMNPADCLGGIYTQWRRIAVSQNGLYAVNYQPDGNLVVYKLSSPHGSEVLPALWATNVTNNVSKIKFDYDGNILVLRTEWNGAISTLWNSGSGGHSTSTYIRNMWVIQDDGNFVGYPMATNLGGYSIGGQPFADTGTTGGRVARGGRVNNIR